MKTNVQLAIECGIFPTPQRRAIFGAREIDTFAAAILAAHEAQRQAPEGRRQRGIVAVYDKLHAGKLGAHWIWCAIGRINAGESESEVLEDFGYVADHEGSHQVGTDPTDAEIDELRVDLRLLCNQYGKRTVPPHVEMQPDKWRPIKTDKLAGHDFEIKLARLERFAEAVTVLDNLNKSGKLGDLAKALAGLTTSPAS